MYIHLILLVTIILLMYVILSTDDNTSKTKVLAASDLESIQNTGYSQYSFYLDNPSNDNVLFEGTIDRINWIPIFATTTSDT
jgi:hypothetical protein